MAKKQDLDIIFVIGMNDTRTASMLYMEDHACVSFFVTALYFRNQLRCGGV